MDTQNTDHPKPATSAKSIAAATPSATAVPSLKQPRKRKRERPMSPSTAKAIELVAKHAGDDAERRHRVDLARQNAVGETWDDAVDTLDDDARLDIFARFYLTASGTNRRKILTHPACPPEEEIRTYIANELAHMLDE